MHFYGATICAHNFDSFQHCIFNIRLLLRLYTSADRPFSTRILLQIKGRSEHNPARVTTESYSKVQRNCKLVNFFGDRFQFLMAIHHWSVCVREFVGILFPISPVMSINRKFVKKVNEEKLSFQMKHRKCLSNQISRILNFHLLFNNFSQMEIIYFLMLDIVTRVTIVCYDRELKLTSDNISLNL